MGSNPTLSVNLDPPVPEPVPELESCEDPDADDQSQTTDDLVGVTEGKFEVASGAATYSIAIDVPPGRAGMQPELAINYNSNSGNGTLGVGFSLSGFSAIGRCGKTIATDGVKGGVYFDARDRFCLDERFGLFDFRDWLYLV